MDALVVGAGAMGGIWAAHLAHAGVRVSVIDASAEVVGSISRRGIVVEAADGVTTARVRATREVTGLPLPDFVFFFVKAHQTRSAAETVRALVSPQSTLVTLQNGWGNADVIAEVLGDERLVIGVTYHSGTVREPGQVAHTGRGQTFVGPYRDGAPLDEAAKVGELLRSAGLATAVTASVKTEIWRKLVLNAATLPTAALARLAAGELLASPEMLALVDELAAEAVAVGRAQGFEVELEERRERIRATLRAAGSGKPSMLQDVEAERKTEVEVINGAVVARAAAYGISVPLNQAMVALVHGLEASWHR